MTTWDDEDQPQIPQPPVPEGGLVAAVSRLPESGTVKFASRPLGGYDRSEVDAYVADLARTIDEVRAALAEDRRELAAHHRELAGLRAENTKLRSTDSAELEREVTLGAVGLLSQAQVIADKAVADAEEYARDLVLTARTQYREAQERTAATAAAAPTEPATTTASIPLPSMPEIEYVRTYAQVAQIQLRSVLDALTEQVDRLGTLPLPLPDAAESAESAVHALPDDEFPDEEPDWIPAVPPQPTIQRQTYASP
ncbi:DivIVA domain-containing protein [Agromyces hippuratus]|uniref:DivIVA domain-containing protein n=1 Tax=Agromyces hippuratus TaxID=286438 RepID=A0A852X1D3_9MICO|nr:DivIVA domain-containing protein [Agromyces hippuratus]NYG21224.1 DivIVA domain-containing protein [Agromyces hippuratus]